MTERQTTTGDPFEEARRKGIEWQFDNSGNLIGYTQHGASYTPREWAEKSRLERIEEKLDRLLAILEPQAGAKESSGA